MLSVESQVEALVDGGQYENALALCMMSAGSFSGNAKAIEERYAYALYSRGDFEGASHHWLKAETAPEAVAELFPAIRPLELSMALSSEQMLYKDVTKVGSENFSPEKRHALRSPPVLRGASLSRAAAAITSYFEDVRSRLLAHERIVRDVKSLTPYSQSNVDHEEINSDNAQLSLVDTMLIAARLQCTPPRLKDIVTLLRDPTQKCELEAVAPLLAGGGGAYAEPLLWLYRSKHAHRRALKLLIEDRCCGDFDGAWDRFRFRRWKARYIRWLWFSGNPKHAKLALDHAACIFDTAPALGLAGFTGVEISVRGDEDDLQPPSHSHGGVGMPAQDVVAWMKCLGIRDRPLCTNQDLDSSLWDTPPSFKLCSGLGMWNEDDELASKPLPLDSGSAVACTYLEYLVYAGEELPLLHNELGYLLVYGLKKAEANDSKIASLYRARLRCFLRISTKYEPEALLSWLPKKKNCEKALVMARLADHAAVLYIYSIELRDDDLAEKYCANVWRLAKTMAHDVRLAKLLDVDDCCEFEKHREVVLVAKALDIYLMLAKCYASRPLLDRSKDNSSGDSEHNSTAFENALGSMRRHLDRIHPVKALMSLPKNIPVSRCADFVKVLVRSAESEQRAALVEHNLLRVEFVNLKYELTQQQIKQQSKMSAVPELAHLGRVTRSLQPVTLSEYAEGIEPYHVACTRHIFESHVVLQFHVTNNAEGQRMQNVRVRVESLGDADLYTHNAEVPLKTLPFKSTGSCYVVFRTYPTVDTVVTSFACELRFSVVADQKSSIPPSSYLEEIPLQNMELVTNVTCWAGAVDS